MTENEQVAVEQIDHGTYEDAVTFALDAHDDTLQTYEFLQAWRNGDLDEWPEYYEWLSKRTRALEASQAAEIEALRKGVAELGEVLVLAKPIVDHAFSAAALDSDFEASCAYASILVSLAINKTPTLLKGTPNGQG